MTSQTILLIDDDESIRTVLQMVFEEEGYIVDMAEDGKEAVTKSHKSCYNLAIVDYRLPDTDGVSLIGELRERCPEMIEIMLTGFPTEKLESEAVKAGASAFFQKPVYAEPLTNRVAELLKSKEAQLN